MEVVFGTTSQGRPFFQEGGVLEIELDDGVKVVIRFKNQDVTAVLICCWHGGPNSGGWDKYKAPAAVADTVRRMLREGRSLDEVVEYAYSQFSWDWEWVSSCPWCHNEWRQWTGEDE